MLTLLKNAKVYAPESLGLKDILIASGKIIAIDNQLDFNYKNLIKIDLQGKFITPGFIDQHIHIAGAGGKDGFASLTPDVKIEDLVACGTTTAVGLLGTDATIKSIRGLYAKVQALKQEGVSAFMYSGFYGVDTVTITDSIMSDMIFIDAVLGIKIAIADIRSSYPTAIELVRKLRDVRTGGMLSRKKGIMHIHLGALETKMDLLFELVYEYKFPIEHISPTHVGRTLPLFEQAIEFAKMGGIIDITTAASKYTNPYKSVVYAIEKGVSINNITFSTDGHAGLTKFDENGNAIGIKKAAINENLNEVINLIKIANLDPAEALKLVTTNPARNIGVKQKGEIKIGADADLCCFADNWELTDVFALGKQLMCDKKLLVKSTFE